MKLQAGWRDASFYARPGTAQVHHVAIDKGDGHFSPACNQRRDWPHGVFLDETTLVDAESVPYGGRCQRTGCWKRWPYPSKK